MAKSHGDFIKQCVDNDKAQVFWISSKENLADIMTIPLPHSTHVYLRDKITNIKLKLRE